MPFLKLFIIWLFAVALASLAASQSLTNIAVDRNPALGRGLVPANGHVYAKSATQALKEAALRNDNKLPEHLPAQITAWAKRGYELEPSDTRALPLLADSTSTLTQEQHNDILEHIATITRRNSAANILLSRTLLQQGRRQEALKYYDAAMRTSSAATNVLLPEMVKMLTQKEVVPIYADLLARDPPWHDSFWYLAFRTPKVEANIARLRTALLEYKAYDPGGNIDQTVLKQMVANKRLAQAYQLYSRLKVRMASAETSFADDRSKKAAKNLPPFDWVYVSTSEAGALPIGKASMAITALPDIQQVTVARKLMKLDAGKYALSVERGYGDFDNYQVKVLLACAATQKGDFDKNIVTQALSQEHTRVGFEAGGADCQYLWLEVSVETDVSADPDGVILNFLTINKITS